MKHTLILKTGAIAILFLAFFASCKKEIPQSDKPINTRSSLRTISYSDWPAVESGMLVFRDSTHFLDYINMLDSAIKFSESNTDTTLNNPDEILEEVETSLGYISLRHTTEQAWQSLNEIGWDENEVIPEKHFINSLSVKSVLNSDMDVKIGDYVTHIVNEDYGVVLPQDHPTLLASVHGLSSNATYDDILNLDPGQQFLTIYSLSKVEANVGNRLFKLTGLGFGMQQPLGTTPTICNNPNLLELSGIQLTNTTLTSTSIENSEIMINWGDGTWSGIEPANFTHSGIQHAYGSPGTKNVTIYSRRLGQTGWDYINTYVYQIKLGSCYYTVKASYSTEVLTGNGLNRKFKMRIYIDQWNKVFGNTEWHEIGNKTESFLFTSNKWKSSRIDRVVATFTTTKFDGSCITSWGDNGGSWPYNSDEAECHNTNQGHVGWQKITANNRIYVGSYVQDQYFDLYPCQ